jgi:hypothetical protein
MLRRRPGGEAALDGAKDCGRKPATDVRKAWVRGPSHRRKRARRARWAPPRNLLSHLRLLRPWQSVFNLWIMNFNVAILSNGLGEGRRPF